MQIVLFQCEALNSFAHVFVHRCDDRRRRNFFGQCCQQLLHHFGLAEQLASVQSKQYILSVFQSDRRSPRRFDKSFAVASDGIDEDVADVEHVVVLASRLVEIAVRHLSRGEEEVRQSVGDHPVHFFRHVHIERARACHEMRHFNAGFLCHDRATHRCRQVIDHEYHIRRVLRQFLIEGEHDSCGELRIVAAFDIQIDVGHLHLQIREQ